MGIAITIVSFFLFVALLSNLVMFIYIVRVEKKLAKLRSDWKATDSQPKELTGKIRKFISSTREITKEIFQSIGNKLKGTLGENFFEEKPEKKTTETTARELVEKTKTLAKTITEAKTAEPSDKG